MFYVYLLYIHSSGFCPPFHGCHNNPAPLGKCQRYWCGGTSGVHHFICCNNCDKPDNTCDGETYQGASSGPYCGNCGTVVSGRYDGKNFKKGCVDLSGI